MTRKNHFALLPCLALGIILLGSCANPLSGIYPGGEGKGSLLVSFDEPLARILVPDLDMSIASYTISGTGPDGGSFSQSTAVSPLAVSELESGTWTVSVEALNKDGIGIGEGQAQAAVQPGQTASARVSLKPKAGYGTLALTVLWTAGELQNPALSAQLVPASGSAIPLPFSLSPGQAVYTGTIPTGYFTLSLQLLDGSTPVAGAIEVVRILKNQSTTGRFEFYELNLPGGLIDVDITPEMSDPIAVTLSGQAAELAAGQTMTVSAAVPAGTGNVVCTWYLNGVSKAVGASYTVGGGLAAGTYRLDVTVYSADGLRAGSASHTFTVLAASPTQATLLWDANNEADLAGYRLYYGLASGDYASMVDVGDATSYTLSGLEAGRTYYVVARAYNTSGLESSPSNEVSFRL
jgi:hypothetical protein